MNILIIGFGRAGKRHAKLLHSMGITTGLFDINGIKYSDIDKIYGGDTPPIYQDFNDATGNNVWDIAVIATPPKSHLWYIRECLVRNMWVSCEKPLTSFGKIHEAEYLLSIKLPLERVQVQYNYRFNPDLQEFDAKIKSHAWQFVATQHRLVLPEWGLLLDHCSHDIDMIRWMSKENFSILDATHNITSNTTDQFIINGKMDDGTLVYIMDEVNLVNDKHPRMAKIFSPNGYMEVTPNSQMFVKMWESFFESYRLGLPQEPGFMSALETQRILQDAFEKTNVVTYS